MDASTLSSLGVFRLQAKGSVRAPAFPLGLGQSGMHEVCEASHGDLPALTGFALVASMTQAPARRGAVFWVSQTRLALDHGGLAQAGLAQLRRDPPPLLSARARRPGDALWMIEEAVRSNAVSLVIGELEDLDFTASRRLALAAGRHGVPVILLLAHTRQGATAASARWRVSPRPSAPNRFDPHAPGHPRWRAILERARQAPHMVGTGFDLELNDETLSLTVVSRLAPDAPAPGDTGGPGRAHADTAR